MPEQFTTLMRMPRYGPTAHHDRSFFVRMGNLLVITLDTFEDAGPKFACTVGGGKGSGF